MVWPPLDIIHPWSLVWIQYATGWPLMKVPVTCTLTIEFHCSTVIPHATVTITTVLTHVETKWTHCCLVQISSRAKFTFVIPLTPDREHLNFDIVALCYNLHLIPPLFPPFLPSSLPSLPPSLPPSLFSRLCLSHLWLGAVSKGTSDVLHTRSDGCSPVLLPCVQPKDEGQGGAGDFLGPLRQQLNSLPLSPSGPKQDCVCWGASWAH